MPKERQVPKELKELLAEYKELKEPQDFLDQQVLKEHKVLSQELKVQQVDKEPKVLRGLRVLPKELKEPQDFLDQQVLKELKEL